jgi:dCMP deaminase
MNKWDQRFLDLSRHISGWSKDESTKVGCVIVGHAHEILTTGYNGLTRHCKDDIPERNERPEKYFWYEHAERNAVYNAARIGVSLKGSTAYVSLCPCMDCARGLVQSGVTRVVYPKEVPEHFMKSSNWNEHFKRTHELFNETGIEYAVY